MRQVPNIHIIHQTGERGYNEAQAAYQQAGSSAEVFPFITDMPAFFARADLILCRSGASTVAEITAAGKPAVFVPFPRAADDHQRVNAQALERAGAAVVVEETKLERVWLADTIAALIGDPGRLQRMSEAATEAGASGRGPRHCGDGRAAGGNGRRSSATDLHGMRPGFESSPPFSCLGCELVEFAAQTLLILCLPKFSVFISSASAASA